MLARAVSFLMLPVYTRYLTPGDYGLITVLELLVEVAAIFFTAGATAGLQRFYYKTDDPARRRAVASSAFILTMGLALAAAVVLTVLSPLLWRYALDEAGRLWYIPIAAFNFVAGFLIALPLAFAQTVQRARLFVVASLAKLILQLSLNIYFIVVLQVGVLGFLLSNLITSVVLGGALTAWLIRENGLTLDRDALSDLRRFARPYQLVWAGSFLLTFSDRFFLQPARGLAAVGLYGLAYQFGFLLQQLGATPFINAWTPHRFQLLGLPAEERDARFDRAFLYLNLILIGVGTGIAVFIRPTIRIMTTPEFHSAAALVPWILLAYVLDSWTNVLRFGLDVAERPQLYARATWVSVGLNLALNALLIPRWGAFGAAIASVLGLGSRTVLVYQLAQRTWPIRFTWRRHLLLLVLGAGAALGAMALPKLSLVGLVGSGAVIYLVFLLCAVLLVLPRDERALLATLLRSPRGAWQFMTRES